MHEKALREIASIYGITVEPTAEGLDSIALEDCLISLLKAVNVRINQASEAETVLWQIQEQQLAKMLEPVLVLLETDMPLSTVLSLPSGGNSAYQWTLSEENGRQHGGDFKQTELPVQAHISANARQYALCRLTLPVTLPRGYHHFTVQAAAPPPHNGPPAEQLIIVTPLHCYVPPGLTGENRIWGLSTHLHAIKSRNNWGLGDFSDLLKILNRSAETGAGALHCTPLYSCLTFPEPPNPYSPSCRTMLDPLLVDVEAIADFRECEEAHEMVYEAKFQARLAMIKDQEQIDYTAVCEIKNELFRKLWNYFSSNHLNPETSRGTEFRHFQKQGGEPLHYYSAFASLSEKFNSGECRQTDWHDWPEAFREFDSPTVNNFVTEHQNEIEYHQYLQWLTEAQLAALGHRSMELGLKLGLLVDFPYGSSLKGFESWYYRALLADGALVAPHPGDAAGNDPAVGLPLYIPQSLKNMRFRPFIEGLQHSMRYAGALIIKSVSNYLQTFFSVAGPASPWKSSISFPFSDMIGIIALESQRNRCLVAADTSHLLPRAQQEELRQRNIFSSADFLRAETIAGKWLPASDYPPNAIVRSSPPFGATMGGFWKGNDIAIKAAEQLFAHEAEKEKAIISRAADRAYFLIALDHEGLLPEHCSVDPATVPAMDHALIAALQILLARTPAKILLVAINDLLGMEDQAEPPSYASQQFWHREYPLDLEEIFANQEIALLLKALCRERGVGSVRPSALPADRKERVGRRVPQSFYRLQLHKDFTFQQATAIVPYLGRLGISHCYVSPLLMARPGSPHCYDIIDHSRINPEIGNREDFENFLAALEQHHMALILDIVPNHMGIGSDNLWWMDVLENGEASKYCRFFDINWQPQQPDLAGRVLLPVLGDYYGNIIESGQLALCFSDTLGSFSVTYSTHRFPVTPRTYPTILGYDLPRLEERIGKDHLGFQELQSLMHSLANLPHRHEISPELMQIHHRNQEVNKRALARLCRDNPLIKQFIEENVIVFNGIPDKPESFDLIHLLLEEQPYRLAYWRVASDEINYRRFFDINDLAGLRMEAMEVFRETHRLILDLVATGKLDGLRIDHPDGLYDPDQYFSRLQAAAAGELKNNHLEFPHHALRANDILLYVVAEKVLADCEPIPENWLVAGTTGYDFSNHLNGLFVDGRFEKKITSIYHQFLGMRMDFDQLLYESKRLIIRTSMAGELNVLASRLYRLAQGNRHTRDFTFNHLREGLIEFVCCLPVYRTYIASEEITERDIQFIQLTAATASARKQFTDNSVVNFIKSVLLLETTSKTDKSKHLDFVMKFQQYTGPVMAKGFEDTSFYIYNRLLSLNEVGGDPRRFGLTVAAFHQTNHDRFRLWPQSMLNTSTHDSKRSEDVRARLNVLSEMAPEWQQRVNRWSKQNRSLKVQLGQIVAPTKNDEYAFYQNLLGAWPIPPVTEEDRLNFIQRMKTMMLKTSREAKVHTSWINPNAPYEEALSGFVDKCLNETQKPFLNDFLAFQQNLAWFGMLNSLSQLFLKLVAPGIPDIYQGNEIWRFCLADPDNRRPVDFHKRQDFLLPMLEQIDAENSDRLALQQELLANLHDGRAKMYTIAQTLRLRNSWPDVFSGGAYQPIEITGSKSDHLCAFSRTQNKRAVLALAPRLYLTMMRGETALPLGDSVWHDTAIKLPADLDGFQFRNVFSPEPVPGGESDKNQPALRAGGLLQFWPVALLKGSTRTA